MLGPEQLSWRARLEADLDNVRAALTWSQDCHDQTAPPPAEVGCRLVGALFWFWYIHCHVTEGARWAEAMLALSDGLPAESRAGVLFVLASLKSVQGDYAATVVLTEESVARYREAGNRWKVAFGVGALGLAPLYLGDHARAAAQFGEGLALSRELDDAWLIAWNLSNLGRVALAEGDHKRAIELFEAGLALRRRIGDPFALSLSFNHLGQAYMAVRDWERAAAISAQHLELARDIGFTRGVATALCDVGRLAYRHGEHEQAIDHFRQGLSVACDVGERATIASAVEGLAAAFAGGAVSLADDATRRRSLARAGRLYGAAATLRLTIGVPLAPADRAEYDRAVATARNGLGDATFQEAWSEGARMPLDQLIRCASASDSLLTE